MFPELNFAHTRLKVGTVKVREDADLTAEVSSFENAPQIAMQARMALSNRVLVKPDVNPTPGEEPSEMRWIFAFNAGVRGLKKGEEEQSKEEQFVPLFEVTGNFEVTYVSEGFEAPEVDQGQIESLQQQAAVDGWPYWVEYMNSSLARIGLPGMIELPRPKRVPVSGETDDDASRTTFSKNLEVD